MVVTATELKSNLGRYLELAEHEDILISKNGRTVAKLSNPNAERGAAMKSLFGILPPQADDIRPDHTGMICHLFCHTGQHHWFSLI